MTSRESKGKMSRNEAGHKGGEKVKGERSREFFREIGRKGGESKGTQK